MLSREGFALRERFAEVGIELTPDQVEETLHEADERIRPGPDGKCVRCRRSHRRDGTSLDFRFGLCDECSFSDVERRALDQLRAVETCRRFSRWVDTQQKEG